MGREKKDQNTKNSLKLKVGDKVKANDMVEVEIVGGTHIKKEGPDGEPRTKKMHRLLATRLEKKGSVKIIGAVATTLLLFLLAFAPLTEVKSQGVLKTMYSSYGASVTGDTVTNTGTAYLTSPELRGQYKTVTITAVGTEISGTTGGSVVLQGSLDGTNFVTLTNTTTVPNIAAKTPADVTTAQVWEWQFKDSPFIYYRVLWTGTGTMSAKLNQGKILAH